MRDSRTRLLQKKSVGKKALAHRGSCLYLYLCSVEKNYIIMSYYWKSDRTEICSNKQREQSRSFVCCRSRKVLMNNNESLLDCEMNVDTKTPFDLRHPLSFLNNRWNRREIDLLFSMAWDICMAIPVHYPTPFDAGKMIKNNIKSTYEIALADRGTQLVVLQQFQSKFSQKCVRLFDDDFLQIPQLRSTAQCDVLFPSEDKTLPTQTATVTNKKISTNKQKLQRRIFDNRKYWRKRISSLRSLRTRDFLEEYMSDSDIPSDDCSVDELSLPVIHEGKKKPVTFDQQTSSTMDVIDLRPPAYVGEAFNNSPPRLGFTEQLPHNVNSAQTKYPPAINVSLEASLLSEVFTISNCVLDDYAEAIEKTIYLKSTDKAEKSFRSYLDCGNVFATSLYADNCEPISVSSWITGVQLTSSTFLKRPWFEQWGVERTCYNNLFTNCMSDLHISSDNGSGLKIYGRQSNITLVEETFSALPIEYKPTSSNDDTTTICDEQSSLDSHTTVEFNLIEQDGWTVVQPTGIQSAENLQPDSEKNEEWVVIDEFLNQQCV
ncbi:hypothetical protein EG68_00039 [Paragonimus skrjabini miyazakii]|uniref:Uncharacterized protein n=1 Tax=Paragonimus skrjabini miyazakii TaxID=59628 RepID=A0A8S9Z9U3_9TREM|nr:hypothetical protein EG68_00039 [Paragonimus skrjabini miyazakii]